MGGRSTRTPSARPTRSVDREGDDATTGSIPDGKRGGCIELVLARPSGRHPLRPRMALAGRRNSRPIEPCEYYVVAVEADGNRTLVHRSGGELLLFAPDHAVEA